MDSAGKRTIVTGASSGIGAALARELARRGAHVGMLARREQELRTLCEELQSRFPRQVFCFQAADVCLESELEAALERIIDQLGGLDIVIANSGIGEVRSAFSSHHWEIARDTLSVNLLGAIHTLEYAKNCLVKRRCGGQLVGISSVAAARGFPRAAAYCASKAALAVYLESIRGELAGAGIGVISIHPGFVRTPMTSGNPYMPWLMDPEPAARRIVNAIETRKKRYVFPVPMRMVYWFWRHIPDRVYDFWCVTRKPSGQKTSMKGSS